MCKRFFQCSRWGIARKAILVGAFVLIGCDEGGGAVLRNLSAGNLRVDITFVKVDATDGQAQGCPPVSFSLLPNESVGTPQAREQAQTVRAQDYRYNLKQCIATLDVPHGYSLETGLFTQGETMAQAIQIQISSPSKTVAFQKLDFGFRKIDPKLNIYVWDYGWGI